MVKPKNRKTYIYRCGICGHECRKKLIHGSNVPLTKTGTYGNNATPTPIAFVDDMYLNARTVSFTAAAGDAPAQLADSAYLFGEKHFKQGLVIRVSTDSGTNDGDYTIADKGVSRGTILLSSSDSLTTETANTAGNVSISRIIYKPNVTTGCPFCGSLHSKQ